jgi:hypothetical protein
MSMRFQSRTLDNVFTWEVYRRRALNPTQGANPPLPTTSWTMVYRFSGARVMSSGMDEIFPGAPITLIDARAFLPPEAYAVLKTGDTILCVDDQSFWQVKSIKDMPHVCVLGLSRQDAIPTQVG